MCGRAVCTYDRNTLATIANVKNLKNGFSYKPSYNMTPTNHVPIIYRQRRNDTENILEAVKWGTTNKDNIPIINARSETADIYPIFKNCNRCVLIIQGYYEWKRDDPSKKQPYYFHFKNDEPLFVAGLYRISDDQVIIFKLMLIKYSMVMSRRNVFY
jgi:putative SOS response-associated peptidase YedK